MLNAQRQSARTSSPATDAGGSRLRLIPAMIGDSEGMRRLWSMIRSVAPRHCTVLIHGESGTGKELLARHIHAQSGRAAGPFVPVDCTTLRDTLFESQLFGHVKGAFTGADRETLGFFRSANGGTLFLDEIGELPLTVQAKLLRCIQDQAVTPLGSTEQIPVDVRIVTATHRDLREMVRKGTFREDLYFRLNVVKMTIPSLRERRADVIALADHFLAEQARIYAEPAKTLSDDAIRALESYDWPGNIRELSNAIEHACVFADGGRILASDLPDTIASTTVIAPAPAANQVVPLEVVERQAIVNAIKAAQGNQARTAKLLGIERRRLYRKVQQHKLQGLIKQLAAAGG